MDKKYTVINLILEELDRANKMYGLFNSPHEGWAVMNEEMDELWDEIKNKYPDKIRMLEEAVQVGAMAIKFVLSNC